MIEALTTAIKKNRFLLKLPKNIYIEELICKNQ